LPVLAWGNKHDAASIWRSSQPKVGIQGNRSSSDESYLKWIAESVVNIQKSDVAVQKGFHASVSSTKQDDSNSFLKIFDLRPKSSAMGNRTTGYGYENISNYPYASISFWGISNIHSVRDSYYKLNQLCMANSSTNDIHWLSALEDTKWLSYIRYILAAAWNTALVVHINRLPVLLHCSHGWDRTSQVSALAQILLDPYYRSIQGFATLVEKEFCSFGHPFHTRSAHGEVHLKVSSVNINENQTSPIFFQFLDCVWQILHIFPNFFEFTSRYLLLIADHVYSCRFGTFLCDNEKERDTIANVRTRTFSLWDYLDTWKHLLKNKFYQPQDIVLLPPLSTLLRNVTLWTDFHCRYSPKPLLPSYSQTLFEKDEQNNICHELTFQCQGDDVIRHLEMLQKQEENWKHKYETISKELQSLKQQLNGKK